MEKEVKETKETKEVKETRKKELTIYEKLLKIQTELKAPKNQVNKFGGYNYRSCEDILEAVKPLLEKYNCTLKISDELVNVGERYYIKATALLIDTEKGMVIENTAFAREEESKKGMDGSQITGATSSYCRKYCLNGLFLIDDTKDADTDEFTEQQDKKTKKEYDYRKQLIEYCNKNGIDMNEIANEYSLSGSSKQEDFKKVLDILNAK